MKKQLTMHETRMKTNEKQFITYETRLLEGKLNGRMASAKK